MDWSRFNLHGDAPTKAFESLTGILFERWCYQEYNNLIEQVIFVNGSGGDGGVEAYAILKNGDLVGLQAKWFRESLQDSQIRQIKGSLNTAANVRSRIIRYIVTIPKDLSDVRRDGKTVITERDRWNSFINTAKTEHPAIIIDLWDETRLISLLAELGTEGLTRYWFENSIIDLESLKLKFEQAKSGWLRSRYMPDLHQCGQIEDDLSLRLNGTGYFHKRYQKEAIDVLNLLKKSHDNIRRLNRYTKVSHIPNADTIIAQSLEFISTAISEQEKLCEFLSIPYSFPIHFKPETPDLNYYYSVVDLINKLSENDLNSKDRVNSTAKIAEQLEQTIEAWNNKRITSRALERRGYSVIYTGEAGIGKTHALANTVQKHIEQGKPAILIKARDIDLNDSWEKIIGIAVGESNWNLQQICDALISTTIQSEIRGIAHDSSQSSVRFLIAVDGLDETKRCIKWAEKIGEVIPLAQKYPRLLFAFSSRESLYERFRENFINVDLDCVYIRNSDAPLDKIFNSHCELNHIQCSPLLRWALPTPLAIQLFAELYQNRTIDSSTIQDFRVVELIDLKIKRVDEEIRAKNSQKYSENITPVRDSLRSIAKACLQDGQCLTQDKFLDTIESGQRTPDLLSRTQLLEIVEYCCDRGLLLKRTQYNKEDPLTGDTYTYEFTYQSITDFLLAYEAFLAVKNNPDDHTEIPPYLKEHPDSIVIAVYLLGEKREFDFYNSQLWINGIQGREREKIQFTVLSIIPIQNSVTYCDWPKKLLVRDMPTCQEILRILVEPSLRRPNHPYGANFVHEVLLPLGVAERDLFWSGPYYIPHNHGAKWEGSARNAVLETLDLADDDEWDSAPLLLAWATTSVNNPNRRRIRSVIAKWGSNKPSELLKLLQKTLQTNDPQMREDLMLSAYGAACLVRPDEQWLELCNWIIDFFFQPNSVGNARNVVVRHCASSIVTRCCLCGVSVNERQLDLVNKFSIDPNELLPIDRDAALNVHEHHGYKPITRDLNWYVVPKAVEPFFNSIKHLIFNPQASQSAQEFIQRYVVDYHLPDLNPRKFTFGFVREYINQLGWSEEVFYGKPNGGNDGEIICADIAISRKYGQATHGERSEISTFAEKYVWLAIHELIGVLATCLPAYDFNDRPLGSPVALNLLTKINNPATDLRQPTLDESEALLFPFPDLSPDCELSSSLQIDLANEWVTKAPLPSIDPLIEIDSSYLPDWAKDHKWLTLQSFVTSINDDSRSISSLWTSCFIIPQSRLSILKTGKLEYNQWSEMYNFQGSIKSAESYQDPSELVSSQCIQNIELDQDLIVKNNSDKINTIPAKATSCKFYYHNLDGETNEWIPANYLCQYLKIVDFTGGKFVNKSGDIVAFSLRQRVDHDNNFHVLAIRQDLINGYLKQKKLSIAWGVRIFREPSTAFALLSEQGQRMYRDYKAIVVPSKMGMQAIHTADINQSWGSP